MKRVAQYLTEVIWNICQRRENVQYYTDIVSKHALKQINSGAADSIANDGYNDELELDAILSDAERRILELSSSRENDGFKDIQILDKWNSWRAWSK